MSSVSSVASSGYKPSSIVDHEKFKYVNLEVRPPRVVKGANGSRTYVSFAIRSTKLPLFMKLTGWCGLGYTDPYIKTSPGVAPTKKQIEEAISKASSLSYEVSVPKELLSELEEWDKYMPEYVYENRAVILAGSTILAEKDETMMKKLITRAYKPIVRYSKKDTENKYPKIAVCFRNKNFQRQAGTLDYSQEEKDKNMVLELFENGKPRCVKTHEEMKKFIKPKSKVSQLTTFEFWRLNDQYGVKVMTNNINTLPYKSDYKPPSGNLWGEQVETEQSDSDPYSSNPDDVQVQPYDETSGGDVEGSASVDDSEGLAAEIEAEAETSEELADEEDGSDADDGSEEEEEVAREPTPPPSPEPEKPKAKTVRRATTKGGKTTKAVAK